MLKVVLLQLLVPQWQVLVVEEVVRQVVEDVAEDTSAVDSSRGVPRVGEEGVSKEPEGSGENNEERGRHDETVLVHGKVVVDAMQEEVEGDENPIIGEVSGIES